MEEIGYVVDERLHLNRFGIHFESCLCPVVLSGGMQFLEEKPAAGSQSPLGFGEDVGKVIDMFQHKIAYDEIVGVIFTRPAMGQVRCLKPYVL